MNTEPPVEDFELEMPDDMEIRHCYRHRDRETGVSCANCGRAICHECMVPAAIGFWCPECVAEQNHTRSSRARVVTRSQTRDRWQRSGVLGTTSSPVTRALIVLNVAIYILQLAIPGQRVELKGDLFNYAVLVQHEYWRLATAMFLHANIIHLGVNMLSLYFIGSFFEQLAGRGKYIAIYLLAGLAGNAAALALAPVNSAEVGASTAIFGIFAALIVHVYRNRHAYPSQVLGQLVFWMALNLILTFTNSTISWQGHIGGLVGGVVAIELITRFGRRALRAPFDTTDAAAVVIMLIAIAAFVFWRVQTFVA
jgi:membrane associated rhomboid family serine protease